MISRRRVAHCRRPRACRQPDDAVAVKKRGQGATLSFFASRRRDSIFHRAPRKSRPSLVGRPGLSQGVAGVAVRWSGFAGRPTLFLRHTVRPGLSSRGEKTRSEDGLKRGTSSLVPISVGFQTKIELEINTSGPEEPTARMTSRESAGGRWYGRQGDHEPSHAPPQWGAP